MSGLNRVDLLIRVCYTTHKEVLMMMSYYEWQQDLCRFYDVMPLWYWDSGERMRRYTYYKETRDGKEKDQAQSKDT